MEFKMAWAVLRQKGESKLKRKTKAAHGKETEIQVDEQTHLPSKAWKRLREFHHIHQLPTDYFVNQPYKRTSLRFVCISDTHGAIEHPRQEYQSRIPNGDVLIHCGDFTMRSNPSEIIRFDSFISRLPHPIKMVIAGNHELTFEREHYDYGIHQELILKQLGLSLKATDAEVVVACKDLLQHILYLEDEAVNICGIKVYGSPWVPEFGSSAFSLRRGDELLKKWNQIPSDTDILITHSPPCGYGDMVCGGKNAGCVELLNTVVQRVKPKFHVFGHIHSGYGMWTNKQTTFINASVCSNMYKPDHDPIVFDLPLPSGYTREDFAQLSTETLRLAQKQTETLRLAQKQTDMAEQCEQLTRGGKDANHVAIDSFIKRVIGEE